MRRESGGVACEEADGNPALKKFLALLGAVTPRCQPGTRRPCGGMVDTIVLETIAQSERAGPIPVRGTCYVHI